MNIKPTPFAGAARPSMHSDAAAAPLKPNLLVFGDSLSDNGNTNALAPIAGHFNGRFTTSYVWNEYTAKLLDTNLINMAHGYATTDNELTVGVHNNHTIPSLHNQVTQWLQQNRQISQFNLDNDIVSVAIGSNDLLNNQDALLHAKINPFTFASQLAKNIARDVMLLKNAGYKNIFVWNLPAANKTPMFANTPVKRTIVNGAISALNTAISVALIPAKNQGVHLLDLNDLVGTCLRSEVLRELQITNSKGSCYADGRFDGTVGECENPDKYFFSDLIHPSNRVHYLWGVGAALFFQNPSVRAKEEVFIALARAFAIGRSTRKSNVIVNGVTDVQRAAIHTILYG